MKKIIQVFRKLLFKFWLKKHGINPAELLQGVQVQKFLDNNPRSSFDLEHSIPLRDVIDLGFDFSKCDFLELDDETV